MNKRRLASSLMGALLVAMFLPNVAAASSVGSCGSGGSNAYHSGEDPNAIRYGIAADIEVFRWTVSNPNNFYPCNPDDNAGTNASGANIGISHGLLWANVWVEVGVIACNSSQPAYWGAWPLGLCDGRTHVFVEQHGAAPWDYNMWDEGCICDDNVHTYSISYYGGKFNTFLDGVGLIAVDMGAGLSPTNTNTFYWQAETQDPGDGLGTSAKATNIGEMRTKLDTGTWSYHPVNGACDVLDSQQHCVANGTYGFYAYTVN